MNYIAEHVGAGTGTARYDGVPGTRNNFPYSSYDDGHHGYNSYNDGYHGYNSYDNGHHSNFHGYH